MANLEGLLRKYLERTDDGVAAVDEIPVDLLALQEQLRHASGQAPSMAGRVRGEHRMLVALADSKSATGPARRRTLGFSAALPKAALTAFGLLALTGGAMTASAAAGGPNVPVAVLTAVGINSLGPWSAPDPRGQHSGDKGNGPANHDLRDDASVPDEPKNDRANPKAGGAQSNASETGLEHGNGHADGPKPKDEAKEEGAPPPNSGIDHSNASETGRENANANASNDEKSKEPGESRAPGTGNKKPPTD